ncbi:hypothetical protein HYW74_01435 [Candidatus Pacearchaeota archaeon]|nr:hypothetical protein [Candidatus Pacearchaeota archaeon]
MVKKSSNRDFVKILLKMPVKNIRFSGNRISLSFFNHKISDKITIKREDHVAEWSRKRKEIFIDRNFGEREKEKSFRALCIHEVIESFLVKEFKLRLDEEAHVVATQKEKEYLESAKGNWKSHELKVFWDWHKMGEH